MYHNLSAKSNANSRVEKHVIPTSTRQHYDCTASKQLPRIAFRAFSNESQGTNSINGFVAGMFLQVSRIPPPPDSPFGNHYQHEALRHIAPLNSGPTPFISVTRSLVRAIHRALRIGPDSSIATIDLHEADKGDSVQSAVMLDLNPTHRYRPHGEL